MGMVLDNADVMFIGLTKKEWNDPFSDTSYWWVIKYCNDPFCSRCVKPRLLFLDWVIAVLTAYKNEYCNK